MGIIYGRPLIVGGKKPISLDVSTNGTWSRDGGYSPINVSVPASAVTNGSLDINNNGVFDVTNYKNADVSIPASAVTSGSLSIDNNGVFDVTNYKNADVSVSASAVTSGTLLITADGNYDVTTYKNVTVMTVPFTASTSPASGISYTSGLPSDWNIIKAIAKAISNASSRISLNTTGAIYVSNGKSLHYKITPGDTITVNGYQYAIMGFNNYQLTNKANYGGNNTYAGLTFGMVNCCWKYPINRINGSLTNSGGWGTCSMRTSTMETLKTGMPSTMAQIRTPYYDYGGSSMLYSDDYMFLPAEKEVFGSRTYSPAGEANALTQYAYYKNGGSKIKSFNGSATWWWLRSVDSSNDYSFCCVYSGSDAGHYAASNNGGAAPCFCV